MIIGAFRFGPAHRKFSLQRLTRSIHIRAVNQAASPWFAATVQHLVDESCSTRPGAQVVVNRLADVLLVEAIRSFIAGLECPLHQLRAFSNPRIGAALELLHETLAEPWTVARLAAAVGLSRSGFAARFRALVGEPPLEYLARWRMTRAAKLLRETNLPMSEVAECVGYRSEGAFNKAFRRLEGVTKVDSVVSSTDKSFRRRDLQRSCSPDSGADQIGRSYGDPALSVAAFSVRVRARLFRSKLTLPGP